MRDFQGDASLPYNSKLVQENLVKSRQRVNDHGEVFTPAWLVNQMLSLVEAETTRIDSRFLEPACGSGNFLLPVLQRKLDQVQAIYGSQEFEKRHQALLALMSLYGIDILEDNVQECRHRLLETFSRFMQIKDGGALMRAAVTVLDCNIVVGDAMTMTSATSEPIVFAEWAYIGKGKFSRRDFRFDSLTQIANFSSDTLFSEPDVDVFSPIQDYELATIEDLSK